MEVLRLGILGTARISRAALIDPARQVSDTVVAAVAARDLPRADAFALSHGIATAYGSYDELLADPSIDAVYNPLPNSLHGPWTMRAIAAGKHVLCEKPFASNAAEAQQVADAAAASGLVVMDAMHYRYHPLIQRAQEIIRDGTIGRVWNIECETKFVIPDPADIRYNYRLGGGALMDGGCYSIDFIRLVLDADARSASSGGGLPATVTGALADPLPGDGRFVDRALTARFTTTDAGTSAWFDSAFQMDGEFQAVAHVAGEEGSLWLTNFILAHEGRLVVTKKGSAVVDEQGDGDTTYVWQLRAFAGAIVRGEPFPTTAASAVATMRLVDDTYTAAGLPLRGQDPGTDK